jgi:drug/metabolite transporter (DMT)-like permease
MPVPIAYLLVVLIWSTTPLTVKWSGEGVGFLFGVTGRMVLGTLLSLIALKLSGVALPLHGRAHKTYIASSIGVFGAMLCVYWAAQFIPSGFISVIFAIAPIFTGLLAAWLLQERNLTLAKLCGFALSFGGIALVFQSSLSIGGDAWKGIAGSLTAVMMFSVSGVLVKKFGDDMHALATNTGGLLYGTILFVMIWALYDGHWPHVMSTKTAGSILYLGIVGTVIGFTLYMHLLKQQSPSSLAMVTLITPVTALHLGSWLNHEIIGSQIWYGTAMILVGLVLYTAPKDYIQRYFGEAGPYWRFHVNKKKMF